jgi:hypothetical protein
MKSVDNKLNFLLRYLNDIGLNRESAYIKKILKVASFDYPIEETEIESKKELFLYLKKNPGEFIFLDNPIGTFKSFGDNKKKLPFHYGEFPGLINPSDYMGWDIIIVPSSNYGVIDGEFGEVSSGHDLIPVGYVPVNNSEDDWMNNAAKLPPIGNDKIILAPNGKYLNSDIEMIKDFFSDLWQFSKIKLL